MDIAGGGRRCLLSAAAAAAVVQVATAAAPATTRAHPPPGHVMECNQGDRAGISVSGAGDVDGDGHEEVVYGAPGADGRGGQGGRATILTHPLERELSRAIHVEGGASGDRLGRAVAAAGDVNGDGFDDVVIGAPGLDAETKVDTGGAYVLLGSADLDRWDVTAGDFRGFTITGAQSGDRAGSAVAAAGDVNADGFDDVVVGAPRADVLGRENAGAGYVVFGSSAPTSIDLAADEMHATRIYGGRSFDRAGVSVAGLGDVNRDGLDDVGIGAYGFDGEDGGFTGAAFVLWGSIAPTAIDLALVGHLREVGFAIIGARAGDDAGSMVAAAGDVNLDGAADIAVGARGVDSRPYLNVGAAYVLFGQEAEARIDLRHFHDFGYRILGSRPFDLTGSSLASLGDVTRDGVPDLAVAAPKASRRAHRTGAVYFVAGQQTRGRLRLPQARLLHITGVGRMAELGTSVAGNVDINGDSHVDVLIGVPGEKHGGARRCGDIRILIGPLLG